jgi:C1A family cysteine protease
VSPQTAPTAATLESYLTNYGPLVTTMNVYSDFYNYVGGVYSYTGGPYEGAHAIEIIGYNHAAQYFIVKNSWGTGWGTTVPGSVTMPGFFYIAYSQIANVVQFGWYSIAYTGYKSRPLQLVPIVQFGSCNLFRGKSLSERNCDVRMFLAGREQCKLDKYRIRRKGHG